MAAAEQIKQALATVPRSRQPLPGSEMDLSANTVDEESVVASYKAQRPIGLRDGEIYEADIPAYESFSTDATADNTETFNLSHDLVDSDTVAEDLVLYLAGTGYVSPDAVDYDTNTFDYTDSGTDNTIHAWYMTADQAPVSIRKVSPKNVPEEIDEDDMGLKNLRNQHKDPLRFDFDHPFQGIVPTDWEIEVRIDAPYAVSWSEEGGDATPTNARISLPIFRARDEIQGLGGFIGAIAGRR